MTSTKRTEARPSSTIRPGGPPRSGSVCPSASGLTCWTRRSRQWARKAERWDGRGPAQASGFTDQHPLDEVFHPPIIVYRNDDQLRDWYESTEHQERTVAEAVEQVRAAEDVDERPLQAQCALSNVPPILRIPRPLVRSSRCAMGRSMCSGTQWAREGIRNGSRTTQ